MPRAKQKPKNRRPRGLGTIVPKNGKYYAVYRDILTDKRRWVPFASEVEAEAHLSRWRAEKQETKLAEKREAEAAITRRRTPRAPGATHPWTFGELCTEWETTYRSTVSASSWRDYGSSLADLRVVFGSRPAQALAHREFQAFKQARLDGLKTPGGAKKLSPATVNKRLDIARRVFDHAIKRELVDGPNPVAGVPRAKVDEYVPAVLEEADLQKLIAAAGEDIRLRAHVRCHVELALRFGEAAGLPLNAYSREKGTIHIRQQVVEERERKPGSDRETSVFLIKHMPKTSKGERFLKCSRALRVELEWILDHQQGRPNQHGLFFPLTNGAPLREGNWIRDHWKPLLVRAGVIQNLDDYGALPRGERITPHSLRHSRIALIARRHSSVFANRLQRFAGHSHLSTTLGVYGPHFADGALEPEEYLTDPKQELQAAALGDPESEVSTGSQKLRAASPEEIADQFEKMLRDAADSTDEAVLAAARRAIPWQRIVEQLGRVAADELESEDEEAILAAAQAILERRAA